MYGDPWGFHAIKNVRVPLVLLQINFKCTTYLMNINLYIFRSYRIEINIFTFKTYFEAKNIMRIIDIKLFTVEFSCYMLNSQFAGALDCIFQKYCSSKCNSYRLIYYPNGMGSM